MSDLHRLIKPQPQVAYIINGIFQRYSKVKHGLGESGQQLAVLGQEVAEFVDLSRSDRVVDRSNGL